MQNESTNISSNRTTPTETNNSQKLYKNYDQAEEGKQRKHLSIYNKNIRLP